MPAKAIEIFGITLFGGGDEPAPEPGALPYGVEIIVLGDAGLRGRLSGASGLLADADRPSPGDAALISAARRDYQRLLGVLYGAGRYGGTISITIDGREAADLALDTTFGETADVVILVDTGPQYTFGDVAIDGRPGPIRTDRTLPPTPEELGLEPGAPARSTAIKSAEGALVESWREAGYPKAAIARRTATAYHPRQEVGVDMTVDPGRAAVFGETTVSGTERMDPVFVAYYAGIKPGEPFDPDDLKRARDQLRRLEVFQATRITEADRITNGGFLPLNIDVAERKRRVFGAGAKLSTADGAGFDTYWRHRNLFGRAEKLRLEARASGIDGDNPNEYNYRAAATFQKPGLFTPYTDLTATIFAEQNAPETYRARTAGARAIFSHRPTTRLTMSGGLSVEASTIDNTDVGDGEFLFVSAPFALDYDGANDRYDPTRGFRVRAEVEPFYEAQFGNPGVVTGLEGSVYRGLGPNDRVVLAARARAGSIIGTPLDETPANRLYFAGGGGSIRGYPYREVGPLDADGDVIGGRSVFTAAVEARIGVTERIQVVPFLDAGNAFLSEYPDFDEPLRFGAGVGLRYKTGLGPMRVDVAVPLDPLENDPPFAFYLGLGQAF